MFWASGASQTMIGNPEIKKKLRRRTNVQQLTCKIDLPFSFYYLFFSFVLLELKPFVLKGKALGKKLWKVWKIMKKCEKLWNDFALQLFCPLVFFSEKKNSHRITKQILDTIASWRKDPVACRENSAASSKQLCLHLRRLIIREPQMGGQICRGWNWRFSGAPIFRPEIPKPFKNRYLGTSGPKIGAPQKCQIQPRRIWPPICGPLKLIIKERLLRWPGD